MNWLRLGLSATGGKYRVMRDVEGGVATFEPFIRYHTFADFSVNFSVILRAREFTDQFLVKHEFIKRLHERYLREGVEIPFPIRTVYFREIERSRRQIEGSDNDN
jgi:small-conductance mechanosensitive channel